MKNNSLIIADPHMVVRVGLRTILETRDDICVIGEAADGYAAIDLVGKLRPDLVILEMQLPGVNGVDVTRRIVSGHPHVRVIGWSAELNLDQARSFFDAGGRGLLRKNGTVEGLFESVDAVLDGGAHVGGALSLEHKRAAHTPSRPVGSPGRKRLTPREREVLHLVAEGLSTRTVADELFISVKTVESHRKNIMDKLDLRSVAELTKYAVREGISSVDA